MVVVWLVDYDGRPLYGKEVHFYVSSDGFVWHYIGYAVTDEDGYAYITYEVNQKTWFKAEFRGDEFYEVSSGVVVWDPCKPLVVTNVGVLDKIVFCIGDVGITVFVLLVAFLLVWLLYRGR
jgi:hypothetical protein